MISFVEYELATGNIKRFGNVPAESDFNFLTPQEGNAVIQAVGQRNAKVNLTTLQIEEIDINSLVAEWGEIREKRNSLEQSPIMVSGFGMFDVDAISLERMQLAIEHFNDLPTLISGKLQWKLADNSFIGLDLTELQTVYAECKRLLTVRASVLFTKAEQFLAEGKTRGEIQNDVIWS